MRRMLVIAALMLTAAGCETDDDHGEALCAVACSCLTGSATEEGRCVDECVADVPSNLPSACVECFLSSSCLQLQAGACDDACNFDDVDAPSRSSVPEEEVP